MTNHSKLLRQPAVGHIGPSPSGAPPPPPSRALTCFPPSRARAGRLASAVRNARCHPASRISFHPGALPSPRIRGHRVILQQRLLEIRFRPTPNPCSGRRRHDSCRPDRPSPATPVAGVLRTPGRGIGKLPRSPQGRLGAQAGRTRLGPTQIPVARVPVFPQPSHRHEAGAHRIKVDVVADLPQCLPRVHQQAFVAPLEQVSPLPRSRLNRLA